MPIEISLIKDLVSQYVLLKINNCQQKIPRKEIMKKIKSIITLLAFLGFALTTAKYTKGCSDKVELSCTFFKLD